MRGSLGAAAAACAMCLAAVPATASAVDGAAVDSAAAALPSVAVSTEAHYLMDEPPEATVMTDSSGNGLDGVIDQDGLDTGYEVLGATGYHWPHRSPTAPPPSPERVIQVPDDAHLDPGTDTFTVEIRYRTTEKFGNVIQKGQATTRGGQWKIQNPGGIPSCLFKDADGNRVATGAITPLNDNTWHVLTCVRTTESVTMYVDGVFRSRKRGVTGTIDNKKPLAIGGKIECDQITVTCDYYSGEIDYVKLTRESQPPPPPPPPPVWRTLGDVPGYAGSAVDAVGLATSGTVAGNVSGGGPLVVWDPAGKATVVDQGFADNTVYDLNDKERVVGRAVTPAGRKVAWTYRNGTTTTLRDGKRATAAQARDINNRGVIVGRVSLRGTDGITHRAALWDTPTARRVLLPTPARYTHASAIWIGEKGVVRGKAWNPSDPGDAVSVRWTTDRKPRVVTWPRGFTPSAYAGAYVAGAVTGTDGIPHAAVKGPDGLVVLNVDDAPYGSRATSVTPGGQAAGWIFGAPKASAPQDSFVMDSTGAIWVVPDRLVEVLRSFDDTSGLFESSGGWEVGSYLDRLAL